jgi:site-specific DNA recombinase
MERIIGYDRVSSRQQAMEGYSLEVQHARLMAAGASEILIDVESAYKNKKRENFERLIKLIENQEIDGIIATRLDRFCRNTKESCALFDLLIEKKVSLQLLDEHIDLSTAAGRMVAQMFAAIAEHQSSQKSENIRDGMAFLRSKQEICTAPFGYKVMSKKLFFNDGPFLCDLTNHRAISKLDIARETIDMFLEKRSLRATIAYFIEKYSICYYKKDGMRDKYPFFLQPESLKRWLTSPVLRGHLRYFVEEQERIIYNAHDLILIDKSVDREIKNILKVNKKLRGWSKTAKTPKLFTGFIYCKSCQGSCFAMTCVRKNKTYEYYSCGQNRQVGDCSNKKFIKTDVIESLVIEKLTERSHKISEKLIEPDRRPTEPPELQQLRSQLFSLNAIPNPTQSILNAIVDLENQIATFALGLPADNFQDSRRLELMTKYFASPEAWKKIEPEQRKLVYADLVERIIVGEGQVVSIELKI